MNMHDIDGIYVILGHIGDDFTDSDPYIEYRKYIHNNSSSMKYCLYNNKTGLKQFYRNDYMVMHGLNKFTDKVIAELKKGEQK